MTARLTESSTSWCSSAWNSTRPQCGYPWGAFGTVENAHSQRFSVSGQSGFENTQGRVRRPLSLSPHAGKPRCVAPKRRSADGRNAADGADGGNAADGRNPAGEYAYRPAPVFRCALARPTGWSHNKTRPRPGVCPGGVARKLTGLSMGVRRAFWVAPA